MVSRRDWRGISFWPKYVFIFHISMSLMRCFLVSLRLRIKSRTIREVYSNTVLRSQADVPSRRFLEPVRSQTIRDLCHFRRYRITLIIRTSQLSVAYEKIRFLGGKLGKAIADEYDASTVGDLLCDRLPSCSWF